MARESTLTVSLTPKLRDYVRSRVESGDYESASEFIRESLRAMQEDEKQKRLYWSDVRRKVAEGLKDIEEGRTVDGPNAMRKKIAALKRRSAAGGKSR